ncbi:MAG: hypothetical protein U5S82_07945 [Gammaproteobacteria bacterium]|nr:hypothetical protein [Gammaproteobacteria bacterium]
MKNTNVTLWKLGAAAGAVLFVTTALAGDAIGNKPAGDIKATGWYPARVIDQRGMERYTQAWDLEPCINGGASRDGLHGSREEAEVLDESVADTHGVPVPAADTIRGSESR